MSTSRQAAVAVLDAVAEGAFADVALRDALRHTRLSGPAAQRATALAFGTVRLRQRCDFVLRPLFNRPFENVEPRLLSILRVGAYELLWADRANAPSVVHDLVETARRTHERLVPIANAVLRRVADNAATLREPPAGIELDLAQRLTQWESHPAPLVERWREVYGDEATLAICLANNREPEVCLRVNPLRATPERVIAALDSAGVSSERGGLHPLALRIQRGGRVDELPGFRQGWFSVQDEAAMLVAPLTGAQRGQQAIDLCAAPGGKSTHLAEMMQNEGSVLACDRNELRLASLEPAAARLGLSIVTLRPGDARGLERSVQPVDVVLLDAPCSGTGTLARRADLRWRLPPQRLLDLVPLQRELLRTAAALVKPGGILVYSTCSLEPEENARQMAWLAEVEPGLVPDSAVDARPPGWDAARAEAQVLPSADGHDGFYMARRRRAIHRGRGRRVADGR